MPTGIIQCNAVTGGVLPCEGVYLAVSDQYGTVVAEVFTDAGGIAEPVEVYAPPKEWSLQQENTEQPYSIYDIYAYLQGYEEISIYGVQVFEGQTALAELDLQPLVDETSAQGIGTVYDIPDHSLYIGSGEYSTAPIENCAASQILNEVVIPQYITVHLGRPAASAQNVTVSFKNYIKNVASSEIYPTWPEQSLRANIYCQISLALNRIYTEWYLSKGYSFQITNSTSYDQYFVYGRTIFENISAIVDDIFNTYIRRVGTVNPFYAEYCDGKSVTCPGLKQWGTVTLAEQGMSAINILRYYYGTGIELVTTNNIASIPSSYPGAPLTVGSSGSAVRTIQRQLNRIAQNYPFFGTLSVDGVFGAGTATVVRAFQKQFNLTQDGVVGRATWYQISYIYVAVKRLAELSSEGEYPNGDSVSDIEGAWPGTVLTVGSSGAYVRQVQYWLNTVRGYISGLPLLSVDGVYGNATASAVRVFQTWAGLTADGIVGQTTWNRLYREFSSVILEENGELGYVTQYPGTALSVGSSGGAVRTIQFWLVIAGLKYTAVPEIQVDGAFGNATATAVRAFQSTFALTADGVVGNTTWNKLREVFVAVVLNLVAANALPGTYPGYVLRQGSSGTPVREIQYYLFVLSKYYTTIPGVTYDGVYGSATAASVRAFQALFGLTVDGTVGPATWSAIYAAYIRIITVEGAYRSSDVPTFTVTLGVGSEGDTVLWVQRALNLISLFYEAVQAPIAPQQVTSQATLPEPGAFDADGVYGEYTADAVSSFQAEFLLPVTGEVNAATWESLRAVFDAVNAQDIHGESMAADGSYPNAVLQQGAYGPYVRQLQARLNALGSDYCELSFVQENGVYGDETLEAVRRFQLLYDPPATGSVNSACWQSMTDMTERLMCPCRSNT